MRTTGYFDKRQCQQMLSLLASITQCCQSAEALLNSKNFAGADEELWQAGIELECVENVMDSVDFSTALGLN